MSGRFRSNAWLFIVLLITSLSCRDRRDSLVPYVPVNIVININEPLFFNLTVPTGWVYITGGSRGIIVYRISENEFIALERHSTYDPNSNCAVAVTDNNQIVQDPCSGSQWLITDGSVVKGPANRPLIDYDVSFQNPYLYINN